MTATTEPPGVPVDWYSSKKSAVTVDDTGLVTMVSTAAVVKAKAGGKTAECQVNVKEGRELAGLYQITNETESETEKDYIDLSARTEATMLAKALAYIKENGSNDTKYEILLDTDETADSGYSIGSEITNSSTGTKTNLTIKLKGTKSGDMANNITITKEIKEWEGALFTVYENAAADTPHLILENITLRGDIGNETELVLIGNGTSKKGQLTMKDGSRITGNTVSSEYAINVSAVISLKAGGTFIMDGGSIDNNRGTENTVKGGVWGVANSTITMNGGIIENNESVKENGGGVFSAGTFTKTGGVIYGNNADETNANVFTNNGHIIFGSGSKWRDSTADETVTMDNSIPGEAGGWEG
ncbi:MAG: hypothetical protein LBP37_00915 [Spirochaetaceae bacterium]|nr:hypothetical protein [Spirochaetaceae bacterium]